MGLNAGRVVRDSVSTMRMFPGRAWSQVLSAAITVSHFVCGPVVLVIHAGDNDIGLLRMDELLTLMRADLEHGPGFFQDLVLV